MTPYLTPGRETFPMALPPAVCRVKVVVAGAFAETVNGLELKLQFVYNGRPAQLRVTFPANELTGAMLTTNFVEEPAATDAT